MKRLIDRKRYTPKAVCILLVALIWNVSVYWGARLIASSWPHSDLTSELDHAVPFVPWTIVIYIGSYLFWVVNYILCAMQDAKSRSRLFCADMLAKFVCLIIFLAFPTTNVRPVISKSDFWSEAMKMLYGVDMADNLFPSIHCLVSWLCWIGVRKRKDISALYRYLSLAIALAICVSTMTTRQHVMADVIGGVVLAELSYFVAGFPFMRKFYAGLINGIQRIFRKRK